MQLLQCRTVGGDLHRGGPAAESRLFVKNLAFMPSCDDTIITAGPRRFYAPRSRDASTMKKITETPNHQNI